MKKTSKTTETLQNRTRLEWLLFAALLLALYLFAASSYKWWPLNNPEDNLGTAFYTSRNVSVPASVKEAAQLNGTGASGGTNGTVDRASTSTTNTSTANHSSTSTNSSPTGSTNTTSNGNSGNGGSTSGSSTTPILTLAAGVNVGDSKEQVDAQVNGLSENCAVTVDLPIGLGQQQVCTYSQNGRTVTVTYLNNKVISASLADL